MLPVNQFVAYNKIKSLIRECDVGYIELEEAMKLINAMFWTKKALRRRTEK